MVKHRRWSDKPKPESDIEEKKTVIPEPPNDIKSIILSGTKYVYIVIVAALLSGIFTPLTLGIEIEDVIFGMLTIFLGCVRSAQKFWRCFLECDFPGFSRKRRFFHDLRRFFLKSAGGVFFLNVFF